MYIYSKVSIVRGKTNIKVKYEKLPTCKSKGLQHFQDYEMTVLFLS